MLHRYARVKLLDDTKSWTARITMNWVTPMKLSRYTFLDDYILAELIREYEASDSRGRIQLLERLYQDGAIPPFEIARMAMIDSSAQVRHWIAKCGRHFDYRVNRIPENDNDRENSERNLAELFEKENDPFIKACLRENPHFFDALTRIPDWKEFFSKLTHLERLAAVRNPNLDKEIIEAILDPDDRHLTLSTAQREELGRAIFTNSKFIADTNMETEDFRDGYIWYLNDKHRSTLWKLAAKWPPDSAIPWLIYRFIGAEDETRAQAFRSCNVSSHRVAMLEGCDRTRGEAIELGLVDSDADCRRIAHKKKSYFTPEKLELIVRGDDKDVLLGLALNENLKLDSLQRVKERLRELDEGIGVRWADQTMEKIARTRAPEQPHKLFGEEGQDGDFLRQKIDFIGRAVIELQTQLEKLMSEGNRKRKWF